MEQDSGLLTLAELPQPASLEHFCSHLDADWIEQALTQTGKASMRKRRLPAEQVVWMVIGMALFRDQSISEVVSRLDLSWSKEGDRPDACRSAISNARGRLGAEPMAWLFDKTAKHWSEEQAGQGSWQGLSLYAIDGTCLRLADTPDNAAHFGYVQNGRSQSGFPMLKLAALMELRTRLVCKVAFGPYQKDERALASKLTSAVPAQSLLIVDALYYSADFLLGVTSEESQRHFLTVAHSNISYQVEKELGQGDQLVTMNVSSAAKKKNPSLPATWTARLIHYQHEGHPPRRLLTSLLDHECYGSDDIVALYHERWEIELGFGEIKTDMMHTTTEPLRSKSAERVTQELYGLLLAYNLLRIEIARIAQEAKLPPRRISFTLTYHLILSQLVVLNVTSPGVIPKRLRDLRADIKRFILPPRKPNRRYPRVVKVKMSNFKKKKPSNHGIS